MRNKIAFITGAGGFIGRATALELVRAGVEVALSDLNEETVRETVRQVEALGGKAKAYPADVKSSESVDNAIQTAFADFGGLDIMVHVAGGSARENIRVLVEQRDEVILNTIGVNLMGAIYASRAAARLMIQQGTGGRIINFSSIVGYNGAAGSADYAAAKGGVNGFTKSLAKELGPYGITVNAVAPGVVARPESQGNRHYTHETNLLGVRCRAEDVANLVGFLASDKASFITGQTYVIDGGRSLSLKGSD